MRLLLLNEPDTHKLLRDYGDSIDNFRRESCDDGEQLKMTSDVVLEEYKVKIGSKRRALYEKLSKAYNLL